MIWTEERIALAKASLNKWRGTPHVDRMAEVGKGVDCINFVKEILVDAEIIEPVQLIRYSTRDGMHSQSDRLKDEVAAALHCKEISPGAIEFGDIIIFKNGQGVSAHCGIFADESVWHSLVKRGVSCHPFKLWRHKVDCVLRVEKRGFQNKP
jgi:cell wall-associated NlpC family hydrolase